MSLVFFDVDDPAIPDISVDDFFAKCLLVPKGFSYRGQGDKRWRLVPGAFRDSSGAILPLAERTKRLTYFDTEDFVLDFKRLHAMAEPDEKLVVSDSAGYKKLLMLTFFQHFGLPTPLLDWTSSPLIALFMALFDRPTGAKDVSIFRLNNSILPPDITYQQYDKLYFRRIQAQSGGVMFFGSCTDKQVVVHPMIHAEYASSPSAVNVVSRLNIAIGPGDIDKVHNALRDNGFREDMLFPNSIQWVVKHLKDKLMK